MSRETDDDDSLLRELAAAPDVDVPVELATMILIEPGTVIDAKFEIQERLGAGGMGVVYAAKDLALGRDVAIKLMRLERRIGAGLTALLDREARATARLNHPNIVTLHEFGNWNGILYLVLERLGGETLSTRLESGCLPLVDALAIMQQVAAALAHTHAAGVIHRDLKPQNVFLLADGAVKVLDFGVSGFGLALPMPTGTEHPAEPTRTTVSRAGTPGYMAPEQWRGDPQDARTDLWAFGVMLYELVTGTLPFGLVAPSREPDLAPLAARLPREASDLVALVASCLTLSPEQRASDAADVARVLHRIRARLDPTLTPAVEPRSRASRLARGALVAFGTLAIAVPLAILSRGRESSACDGAEKHLVGIWDPQTRAQLRSRFAQAGPHGSSTWTAVAATIDRYARAWTGMHEQACRAGGPSAPTIARCLDDRKAQLARVLREHGQVRADTIISTLSAAQALAPITDCADPDYLARLAPDAHRSLRSDDGLVRAALTVNGSGLEVIHAALRVGDDFVIAGSAEVGSKLAANRIDSVGWFVARVASDGTLRWYEASAHARTIELVQGTAGDILVAGMFKAETTFAGKTLSAPRGGGDCFAAALDVETGRARWLVTCGATQEGEIRTVDADRDGNLYVVGDYGGRARFGGTREIDADARPTMVPFVASWSPAGALRWVTAGRSTGFARSKGIAVDDDSVLVGTRVTGGGWLGDHELRHGGCIVARLDSATGSIRWVRELEIMKCEIEDVAAVGGRVAAVGRHRGRGAWIEELSVEDGSDRWRARIGTHDQEGFRSALYTDTGTLAVVGYFGSAIAVGDHMLHGNGARDTFIAGFDHTGRVLGAFAFGGAADERTRWIGKGSASTVLVTGRFDSSMIVGSRELRAEGQSDGLLLELALPWLAR